MVSTRRHYNNCQTEREIEGDLTASEESSAGSAKQGRRASRWLWWLYDLFAVSMVVWLIVSHLAGDTVWPIEVIAYVAIILFPVGFVLLPLALWKRRWFGASLQILCALAFVWVLVDTLADGNQSDPPPGSTVVTVLTYNIGDGLATPDALMPMLRDSEADFVGLVEVTDEMAAALDTQLAGLFPYRVIEGGGIPGKALLSRFPITDFDWLEFNPGRPDLRAGIDLAGTPITIIVAHPPPPEITASGVQDRPGTEGQVDSLKALVESIEGPLLMVGDFNITRQHDEYEEIEATGLVDVFNVAGEGFGFTIPARLLPLRVISDRLAEIRVAPLARIDYVWASDDWLPLEAWVGEDAGSDHLPVAARVALPGTAP